MGWAHKENKEEIEETDQGNAMEDDNLETETTSQQWIEIFQKIKIPTRLLVMIVVENDHLRPSEHLT